MRLSKSNESSTGQFYELRVLSGIHKGAALLVTTDSITIGSDKNCTVVLLDEGIEPVHQSLLWKSGLGWVDANSPQLQLPNPFFVNETALAIVAHGTPWIDYRLEPIDGLFTSEKKIGVLSHGSKPLLSLTKFIKSKKSLLGIILLSSLSILAMLVTAWFKSQQFETVVERVDPLKQKPIENLRTMTSIDAEKVEEHVIEDLKENIVIVVTGIESYVLMNDGRRIYIGDSHGAFELTEITPSGPVWIYRNH